MKLFFAIMLLFNSCTSQNKEKVIEQNDISENIIQKSNEETKTNEKATKNLIKVNIILNCCNSFSTKTLSHFL